VLTIGLEGANLSTLVSRVICRTGVIVELDLALIVLATQGKSPYYSSSHSEVGCNDCY
jgi:hypothetical protein